MQRIFRLTKVMFFISLVIVLASGLYLKFFVTKTKNITVQKVAEDIKSSVANDVATIKSDIVSTPASQNSSSGNYKSVSTAVPFIVQAPNGNWRDPVYQNACEESSALMAISWAQGKTSIDSNFANQEIKNISDFETKIFGSYVDTNVDDTARFIKEYFKYNNIEVRKNISASDIIAELEKGNVLIVPMFGQALGNPHYTAPGPIEHMLVVIGYDAKKNEFITNDPGTKFGQGYRYSLSTFVNAIWMYPTSSQPVPYPGQSNAQKAMIVVSRP